MNKNKSEIVIIGAGICGLSCARRLVDEGLSPILLDKGRGFGGRLATRRLLSRFQFDHGAQYFTANGQAFQKVVENALNDGAAASWQSGSGKTKYVGLNGMSGFARYLGRNLSINLQTEIIRITKQTSLWQIETRDRSWIADRVIITAPAPQIINLLNPEHAFVNALQAVRFDPCLTLMVATGAAAEPPFVSRDNPSAELAWIACDSTKPGRDTNGCWVAHATPEWSTRHVELDKVEIAERLLPVFCKMVNCDSSDIQHAESHRWRYARVSNALDQPFLSDAYGSIYAGGDWCLQARVEAAWISGDAIARDLIERL